MNFVIIGADAAGMSAASRAKRKKRDMRVVVVEKTFDVSYSACGMPYNIADRNRDMEELVVRRAEVFREKQGIELYNGYEAKRIDKRNKKVWGINHEGKEFEFSYDKLLIATGAKAIRPDIPGNRDNGVFTLKNLEDGRRIKSYLEEKQVKEVVIIGMGYIALEMSEALVKRNIRVKMIKPNAIFLPWMDRELSERVKEVLKREGVELFPGHPIESIGRKGEKLVVRAPDMNLEGEMVLIAIGVRPNSELAKDAGLSLSIKDSISIHRDFTTSDNHIYAAGDCADTYNIITQEKTYVPLALLANRGGWMVADNVTGENKEFPGIVGTSVFKVFDLQVARTGLTQKEAKRAGFDPISITIHTRSRAHAHPGAKKISVHLIADKKSKRLLGAQMVGEEGVAHRINAIAVALHNQMTVYDYSLCDLAYAPPFGPVWDPTLVAANQLLKRL